MQPSRWNRIRLEGPRKLGRRSPLNIDKIMDRFEARVRRPFTPFGMTPWYSERDWLPRVGVRLDWMPRVDIAVLNDRIIVYIELPGLAAEDLELSILDNVLTIQGERSLPEGISEVQYRRRECPMGRFRRSIIIPGYVGTEDIEADYENGVLKVTLTNILPLLNFGLKEPLLRFLGRFRVT